MFLFLGLAFLGSLYLAVRLPPALIGLVRRRWISLAALLAFLLAAALFLLRYWNVELLPVFERLRPLLLFLLLFFLQASFFLLALHNGLHPDAIRARLPFFRLAIAFFAALLVVLLFISLTRLGITPDPAYWGEPGVAIQGWQLGLALSAGLLVFLLAGFSERASILVPFAIYIIAVALWLSIPWDVLKNGFYISIDPPGNQPLPYSDSGYYDSMAQSLLIGRPYQGQIPTRPLYIVFLALLHAIVGERYVSILVGQTLVLAVIPVLLYFLGKKIHSPAAGVVAALLMIFREFTSLLITSETRVSNTRTLLVDLATLLLVLVSCLLAMRWFQRRDIKSALLAGGGFGALLLLRTQSLLLFPVLLLLAALIFGLRGRPLYLLSSFFVLGLVLSIAPWLLHNYLQSGHLSLEADFQYKVIASQYAYTGNLDIWNFDFEGKGVGQVLLQFLLKDPGFVFGFILNHFFAGWVGGLLALPLIQPYNGLFAPVNMYWLRWDGTLAWYNLALIILYMAVIALGLAAAWRRLRWIGMVPLAFNVGYSLATAVGRFSGWRYDFPADWIPYFYFALGFGELLVLLSLFFGGRERTSKVEVPGDGRALPYRQLFPPAALLLFLGAVPWIATVLAAPRYMDQSQANLLAKIQDAQGAPSQGETNDFLAQPDAVLVEGRLLYPRFFSRGEGKSSAHAWPSYAIRDFPRQGFQLLNDRLTDALFPTRQPYDFPQGADAVLLGCQRQDYVEARLVVFPSLSTSYLSAPLSEGCN
jgi:hypothetical protein